MYGDVATDGTDKNITPKVYYCKSQTVLSHAGKGYMEYSSYSNTLVTETSGEPQSTANVSEKKNITKKKKN